jgi:hypothetical protein
MINDKQFRQMMDETLGTPSDSHKSVTTDSQEFELAEQNQNPRKLSRQSAGMGDRSVPAMQLSPGRRALRSQPQPRSRM